MRKTLESSTIVMARCDRCQRLLRVAATRREDSKPFRRAKAPKGLCPECVVTEFIYNTYPVNMMLDERGPELLLHPLAGEAFKTTILEGCEMTVDEIDWQRVVDQWALPVKIANGNGKNPYRMGDAARRREAGFPRAGLFASDEDRTKALQETTADLINVLRKERGEAPIDPTDVHVDISPGMVNAYVRKKVN